MPTQRGQTLLIPAKGAVATASGVAFVGEAHGGGAIDALSLTPPAGASGNDRLIGLVVGSSTGVSFSSTWTQIGATIESGADVAVALYHARAGDVGAFAVDDINAAGGRLSGLIVAYRGVSVASPIGDGAGQATASGTSHASPSITPAAANSMLVYLAAIDADAAASWTEPGGMTERVDGSSTLSVTWTAADVIQVSTDAVSKTGTSSVSKPGAAFLVALTPA